jgi:hypothetical protein
MIADTPQTDAPSTEARQLRRQLEPRPSACQRDRHGQLEDNADQADAGDDVAEQEPHAEQDVRLQPDS